MTPRQCEIAAESYTACLLAQAGYDVLVQYGANQPDYDLVAVKDKRMLPISVKGSQDGGWMLAVRYKEKGVTYHEAIDRWLAAQRDDVIFFFVQFSAVSVGGVPRVYVARPVMIAEQLKSQRNGEGYGALQEDRLRHSPKSSFSERLPELWNFSALRIDEI
jgi:Holliday junction resolvase-like predicted endonuclease